MKDLVTSLRNQRPATWTHTSCDTVELVELSKLSSEYQRVYSMLASINPERICRVQNPFLWASYQLRREESILRLGAIREEKELWHATTPSYISQITVENFNWRLSSRAKFGQGVCFSPDPQYADRYCTHGGAMILCKVLVGMTKVGSPSSELPCKVNPMYDTTTGNDLKVYVKYMDNEFYPEYVAYYTHVKHVRRQYRHHWFDL